MEFLIAIGSFVFAALLIAWALAELEHKDTALIKWRRRYEKLIYKAEKAAMEHKSKGNYLTAEKLEVYADRLRKQERE